MTLYHTHPYSDIEKLVYKMTKSWSSITDKRDVVQTVILKYLEEKPQMKLGAWVHRKIVELVRHDKAKKRKANDNTIEGAIDYTDLLKSFEIELILDTHEKIELANLIKNGYTQNEIECITGLSRYKQIKLLNEMKKDLE